jgi:hypothetical protein
MLREKAEQEMKPEIHTNEVPLPSGELQVTLAIQTLGGVFEKRFNVTKETQADPAALERAQAFFRQQILGDLKRLRDQLNGWEL